MYLIINKFLRLEMLIKQYDLVENRIPQFSKRASKARNLLIIRTHCRFNISFFKKSRNTVRCLSRLYRQHAIALTNIMSSKVPLIEQFNPLVGKHFFLRNLLLV